MTKHDKNMGFDKPKNQPEDNRDRQMKSHRKKYTKSKHKHTPRHWLGEEKIFYLSDKTVFYIRTMCSGCDKILDWKYVRDESKVHVPRKIIYPIVVYICPECGGIFEPSMNTAPAQHGELCVNCKQC